MVRRRGLWDNMCAMFAPRRLVTAAVLLVVAAPASAADVRVATGTQAELQSTVDAFRADLGALNADVAGSAPTGRREINWDGVPVSLSDPAPFPGDFFNTMSPRGAVFSTPGAGLRVSQTAPVRFGDRNASYPSAFGTFSPLKLFSPLGSNETAVEFRVPGAVTAATSSGFGVVLTDVDRNGVSSVEPLDAQGVSLGRYEVPAAPGDAKFSFVAVRPAAGERIARVRITAGNVALGAPDSATDDAVAIDDVLYGEPQAVGLLGAADPAPVKEGDGPVTFTVSRPADAAVGAGSVAYATGGGTATPGTAFGTDYPPASGRLDFASGETTKAVVVPVGFNPQPEPSETFDLTLSDPRGALAIGDATATATITDVTVMPPNKIAPPRQDAPLPRDTTTPKVAVRARPAVPRAALRKGVRVTFTSSEAGRAVLRVRRGARILLKLPARGVKPGTTTFTVRLGRKQFATLTRRARSVVVEATVTDSAGNAGRATRTLPLKR